MYSGFEGRSCKQLLEKTTWHINSGQTQNFKKFSRPNVLFLISPVFVITAPHPPHFVLSALSDLRYKAPVKLQFSTRYCTFVHDYLLTLFSLTTPANMASQDSSITLYTTQTPNGIKISITLEELG